MTRRHAGIRPLRLKIDYQMARYFRGNVDKDAGGITSQELEQPSCSK